MCVRSIPGINVAGQFFENVHMEAPWRNLMCSVAFVEKALFQR